MEFKVGYSTSIEARRPMDALVDIVRAEKLGFDSLWVEDHFHPWFEKTSDGRTAQSGFAWSWMGSALQATKKTPIGTAVTAPIMRYHPAVVAQAWATMGQMYPGRVMISVGTGEALNEIPTLGIGHMPSNTDRRNMTVEATRLMKDLWASDRPVTFNGSFYKTRDAFLYTKSEKKIPVYFSGIGPMSVKAAASCADHLLTTVIDPDMVKNLTIPAWNAGLKEAGRDPATAEVALLNWYSIDEDYDRALKELQIWGACLDLSVMKEHVHQSQVCTDRACALDPKIVEKMFICATSVEELIKRVEQYRKAGITHMIMGNSSPNTNRGMDALKEVMDAFKS
jgi:Coenzyme F420-dependent N5,N10-methylene tetrahydromethanopterin reductase and related flavin-dependent oxidoreductases